jgi:hypothetical protein
MKIDEENVFIQCDKKSSKNTLYLLGREDGLLRLGG